MNASSHATRLGFSRGWIEFAQALRSPQDMGTYVFFALVFVVVLFFQRNTTLEGTPLTLAMATLPSAMGLVIVMNGIVGSSGSLAADREDGTLLRAKAVPHGTVGYLTGRMVSVSLSGVISLLIMLIAGLFLVPQLLETDALGWATMVAVLVFGLAATLPWGMIIGSLVSNPGMAGMLTFLPIGAITAISGVFYPIQAMPEWAQVIAQIFPIYWLALGMRGALLPDAAAAAELGESWRVLETFGVLGAWAVIGFLLAPPILRRMARKESGSVVQARREQAMKRIN